MSIVIKKIAGLEYRYSQYTYRDKVTGKVVTVSKYIGPVYRRRKMDGFSQILAAGIALATSKKARTTFVPREPKKVLPEISRAVLYDRWLKHEQLTLEQIQERAQLGAKPDILTPEQIAYRDEWREWGERIHAQQAAWLGTPALPQQSAEEVPAEDPEILPDEALPAPDEDGQPSEPGQDEGQSQDASPSAPEASPESSGP